MTKQSDLTEELSAFNDFLGGRHLKFQLDKDSIPTCNECKLSGYATLAWHLAHTKNKNLLGDDGIPETHAVIWQWLEMRTEITNSIVLIDFVARIEKHLYENTYIAGNIFSVADVLLYYSVHEFLSRLSYQDICLNYRNLARWFSHVQASLRETKKFPKLFIARNLIY